MMDVRPIQLDHIAAFSDVIMRIAQEDIFALRAEDLSARAIYRFVTHQIDSHAPMFVVLQAGRVVGWCEVSLSDLPFADHTGVLSMGILDGFRGRGLGAALMQRCLQAASHGGIRRVELSVLENNPLAKKFYTAQGFLVEGRKHQSLQINGVYHDEILMARLLNGGERLH